MSDEDRKGFSIQEMITFMLITSLYSGARLSIGNDSYTAYDDYSRVSFSGKSGRVFTKNVWLDEKNPNEWYHVMGISPQRRKELIEFIEGWKVEGDE